MTRLVIAIVTDATLTIQRKSQRHIWYIFSAAKDNWILYRVLRQSLSILKMVTQPSRRQFPSKKHLIIPAINGLYYMLQIEICRFVWFHQWGIKPHTHFRVWPLASFLLLIKKIHKKNLSTLFFIWLFCFSRNISSLVNVCHLLDDSHSSIKGGTTAGRKKNTINNIIEFIECVRHLACGTAD